MLYELPAFWSRYAAQPASDMKGFSKPSSSSSPESAFCMMVSSIETEARETAATRPTGVVYITMLDDAEKTRARDSIAQVAGISSGTWMWLGDRAPRCASLGGVPTKSISYGNFDAIMWYDCVRFTIPYNLYSYMVQNSYTESFIIPDVTPACVFYQVRQSFQQCPSVVRKRAVPVVGGVRVG